MTRLRDRYLLLLFGAIFVVIGIIAFFIFIDERRFIREEFSAWIETDAVVDDYRVIGTDYSQSGGDYIYVVDFLYTISFDTAVGRISYDKPGESSGKSSTQSYPEDYYNTLPPGTVITICYDPANPEGYRHGSRDDITRAAMDPLRFLISPVVCALGVLGILWAYRPVLKGRKQQTDTWSGSPLD